MTQDLPTAPPGRWVDGAWSWPSLPSPALLVLAVALQVALGALLGHSGDMRMTMTAGYLVGTGQSPYVAQDLTAVFHHVGFDLRSTIGYPPPWPVLAGAISRVARAVSSDLIVFNLALKLPVIAATCGLAYLAGATLHNLGAAPRVVRRAWLALLFNPLILYAGAAWGQIDVIVAALVLAALLLAASARLDLSALVLALAVCVKPTAAPVALTVLLLVAATSLGRAVRYGVVFAAAALVLVVAPFLALGWDATPLRHANAQLSMAGTMSPATIARLFRDPLVLEGHWWLLGLLWIPALLVAMLLPRRDDLGLSGLLALATGLTLVFFLSRTWLSEPNVVVVLAPVLLLGVLGRLDRRLFTLLWAIPLAFTVVNVSPLQLLWVAAPGLMHEGLRASARAADLLLASRVALVVAWQAVGWWTVVTCLRWRPWPAADGAGRHTVETEERDLPPAGPGVRGGAWR
jgi:hypothetical protein